MPSSGSRIHGEFLGRSLASRIRISLLDNFDFVVQLYSNNQSPAGNGWRHQIQLLPTGCILVRSYLLSSLRDAEDAVFGRNGYAYGNSKLRVEYPRSSAAKTGPMGGFGGGGQRGRFGPPTRRSEFRVIVTGRWML